MAGKSSTFNLFKIRFLSIKLTFSRQVRQTFAPKTLNHCSLSQWKVEVKMLAQIAFRPQTCRPRKHPEYPDAEKTSERSSFRCPGKPWLGRGYLRGRCWRGWCLERRSSDQGCHHSISRFRRNHLALRKNNQKRLRETVKNYLTSVCFDSKERHYCTGRKRSKEAKWHYFR